jgi:hypothetical protein
MEANIFALSGRTVNSALRSRREGRVQKLAPSD